MKVAFCCLVFLLCFSFIPKITAQNFTVSTETDLRNAVTTANTNGQSDTITLLNSITITTTELTIFNDASPLTIDGNGFTLSRDTSDPSEFSLFNVEVTGYLVLRDITLTGGYSFNGGAIVNAGQVDIQDSLISDNFVYDDPTTIPLEGRGGAIYNSGIVSIDNTTIRNNTGSNAGGGISNFSAAASMTISNSTISANSSNTAGAGIFNAGSTLTISNTTIANNTAVAGIAGGIHNTGFLSITHSTIVNNSAANTAGAIYNPSIGLVSLRNSIVFGNSQSTGSECFASSGTAVTDSNNILPPEINANSCFVGATDIVPTGAVSSIVGPLADNGGSTQTMALVFGSPAIDAANNANCSSNDQRGVARGVDANATVNNPEVGDCDIGAYEIGAIALYDSNPAEGSSINLGSTAIDTEISTILEIIELGDADLRVSLNSIAGTNAADFSLIGLATSIANNDNPQEISIVCTPSVVGLLTAQLTLTTNDPAQPTVIYDLSCEGLAAPVVTDTVTIILPSGETVIVNAETEYILKTVDNPFATVGQTVNYTIRARNPKTIPLTQVVIYDVFDERLTDIQLVSTTHGTGVFNANTLTVSGFTLQPNEEAVIVVSARIASLRSGDTIPNAAILESPDASVHVSNLALVGDNAQGNSGGAAQVFIVPSQLPSTGESPMWRYWLMAGIGLLGLGAIIRKSRKA